MRETTVSHGDDGYTLVVAEVHWMRSIAASTLDWVCAVSGHRLCASEWGNRLLVDVFDTRDDERLRVPLTTVQARSLEPSFVDQVLWLQLDDELGED